MDINKELKHFKFEQLNEALFLNHPDAIYMLDLEGNFLMVNEEVCRITGYPREALIGHNFDPLIEDSMKDFTTERFQLSMRNIPQRYETSIITKEGIKHIDVTNFPLKSDEQLLAIFGIAKDITDKKKKEIELEKYAALLKLHNDELEVFRKILAHDMRKPVANALGFARLLQSNLSPEKEKEVKRYILQTIESVDVMVRDLNELIALQTAGQESREEIEVLKCVHKIVALLQDDITKEHATVQIAIDKELKINTIKAYCNSIVRNLLSNALKYRSPHRAPHIQIEVSKEKDTLTMIVRDNGIGMDLDLIGNDLFKMNTRFAPKVAEGNGLGLYIVKQQLSLMGGEIQVESQPDKGTTFTLTLPVN